MDKILYTEEELPQKSEKWLKMRQNCIGGSDAAAILGINKYETAKTFWKRKVGKLKPKEITADMAVGNDREDEAREKIKGYLMKNEGIINPQMDQYFAIHPENERIAVSFDGVDLKNGFITEIKCPQRPWNFRSVFEDGIPDHYYPQVQLQLSVANAHWGITKAYFGSYYPEGAYILDRISYIEYLKDLIVIDVDYDPDYCKFILDALTSFWGFIENKEWNDDDYAKILATFAENTKKLK